MCILALCLLLLQGADQPPEATLALDVLDGGDFSLGVHPELDRVPWWRTRSGAPRVEPSKGGGILVLEGGTAVEQPFALHGNAPFVFAGELTGRGAVELEDGAGGVARAEFQFEEPTALQLDRVWLERELGRSSTPRYTLRLFGVDPNVPARWRGLSVTTPAPETTLLEMRSDVLARIDRIVLPYLEHSLDRVGPRATHFVTQLFDTDTAAPAGAPMSRVGFSPLFDNLLFAYHREPREEWGAALTAHLGDFLELCLHPSTGLPRTWDPVADQPADGEPIEIAIHLRFLIDAAERGPQALRQPCLEAAQRIGEWVLAYGVLPTGEVAPKYRPGDGRPYTETAPLRRLDVPAQLARLGARLGDERHLRAAREAVRVLEYAHHWPGTWDRIDPGFDDDYGHYGERAVTMWEAWPNEPAFRDLALSGWHTYAPLWRDAVRHGGNIAADQVRCWRIAERIARLEPELAASIGPLVDEAARLHYKGGQGTDGVWVDVTIFGFDPQRLPVGDTAGVPHNLLEGLAVAHDGKLGLATPETRARFLLAMAATDLAFGGRYGYITGTRRAVGQGATNPAIGSLRLLPALVDLLERLPG